MEKELFKYARRQRKILYAAGVIFLLVGALFGALAFSKADGNQLYQQNDVYGVSNKSDVAIKVYEILGEVGSQEGSKNVLYVVRHEKGYAGLIAPSDAEEIQSLLHSGASEEGIVFVVKQETSPSDVESILHQSVMGSAIASQMNYQKVASLAEYRENQRNVLLSSIAFGILGASVIIMGIVRSQLDLKALEALYVEFPELRHNLDLLNTASSYSDDLLGIRIYKNYLVCMKGGFVIVDLKTVDWIYHSIITTYHGFYAQKSYQLLFYSYTQKKRAIGLAIKRKENPEVNIQALYNYLSEEYPDMLIGPSKKAIFKERRKAQR